MWPNSLVLKFNLGSFKKEASYKGPTPRDSDVTGCCGLGITTLDSEMQVTLKTTNLGNLRVSVFHLENKSLFFWT